LLGQGKFAISQARGRFPDGTPFVISQDSIKPNLIEIPECQNVEVFLCLPVKRLGSIEIDMENSEEGLAREFSQLVDVNDTISGASGVTQVQVAQLNMRLMLEDAKRTDFTCVGVARITERRPDGQIVLDGDYIPSAQNIGAVPKLTRWLDDIVSLLGHRGDALSHRISDGSTSTSELADFLFLQAVNRYQVVLKHLQSLPLVHPERLYESFLQMSGELATFTQNKRRPIELKAYDHCKLDECFNNVIQDLRHALSVVIEQNVIQIPVQARNYGIYVAALQDSSITKHAVFVLAAKASVTDDAIRKQFPQQTKIGPVEKIRDLVNLQIPGIGIRPMPSAPKQVPYHAGYTYFEMDQNHELWPLLSKSGGFAFHIGGDFPNLELELWAIKEK
jgi:type VI secretion system protein ImpJ